MDRKEVAEFKLKDTAINIKGVTLSTMNDGKIIIDIARGKNYEEDYLIVY